MLTLSWHWLDPSAAWVVGVVCGLLALILLAYRMDWNSKPMIIVRSASSDAELAVIFLQGEGIPPARYQPVAEVPTRSTKRPSKTESAPWLMLCSPMPP